MKTEFKDQVRKGVIPCGFCSTGAHETCKGGYRNGDGSVLICGCECADTKPEFCHHCRTQDKGDLGRPWLCDDRDACEVRRVAKANQDPSNAWLNRAINQAALNLISSTTRRRSECKCCGAPTKGGNFLPGHDSKYINQWLEKLDRESLPWMDAYKVIAEISPALADKFKKRVYGA
jgi:hypothetical protein